jgi:hypothetical protein
MTKRELYSAGRVRLERWCHGNNVPPPSIEETDEPKRFGVCAYYRDSVIYISVGACAAIGRAGRAWSYPGYVVDRTPYGVLAHELGHHVDRAHGVGGGVVSHAWRERTKAPALTGYCPNDNEWFAELFRLYVTNPDLLKALRPSVYALMFERWPRHVDWRPWIQVLADAPERHVAAARNKVAAAERPERKAIA